MAERDEDPIELTLDEIRDGMGLSISTEAIGSSLTIIARTGVIERLETGGGLAKLRIDSDLPTWSICSARNPNQAQDHARC